MRDLYICPPKKPPWQPDTEHPGPSGRPQDMQEQQRAKDTLLATRATQDLAHVSRARLGVIFGQSPTRPDDTRDKNTVRCHLSDHMRAQGPLSDTARGLRKTDQGRRTGHGPSDCSSVTRGRAGQSRLRKSFGRCLRGPGLARACDRAGKGVPSHLHDAQYVPTGRPREWQRAG